MTRGAVIKARRGRGLPEVVALGAVRGVVPRKGHCAEVLMGPWPGTRFKPLFWWYITWGVFVFWGGLRTGQGQDCCPQAGNSWIKLWRNLTESLTL